MDSRRIRHVDRHRAVITCSSAILVVTLQEVAHEGSNLRMMAFESEVSAGYKVYLCIGQVALESIGSGRNERRIVPSPPLGGWGADTLFYLTIFCLTIVSKTRWPNIWAPRALKCKRSGKSGKSLASTT